MKLNEILQEGGSGSGRPDEGTRSKKNLWFQRRDLWLNDLRFQYPAVDFDMLSTDEEAEGDLFVVDQTHKQCYGCWRKDLAQGISFNKPRPLHIVAGHRVKLARMVDVPVPGALQ
jgi:hypothetical protein